MIKIHLDPKSEKLFQNDMKNKTTGLLKILKNPQTITLLKGNKSYKKLYLYFYDCRDKVKEQNVENILLANKTSMESYIQLFGKFPKQESEELVDKVFRYETFSKRDCAYKILQNIGVSVCPYCNRQYTFTIKTKKIRPQFDHYYPKSIYPYLAITLYNLIPCCGICNLTKNTLDTVDEPILYPYTEEFGEEVRFQVKNNNVKSFYGLSDNFDVLLNIPSSVDTSLKKKIELQYKKLGLDELYDMHKDYIKDIAKNHYINSNERITELTKKFPSLFNSKDDAIRSLYMNDIRKECWGKRPLAKLTSDIIYELENEK